MTSYKFVVFMEEKTSVNVKRPRPAGRPSRLERSSVQSIDSDIRDITATLIKTLRKDLKNMSVQEKTNLLGKLLPYVCKDDAVDDGDITVELLVGKYVKSIG